MAAAIRDGSLAVADLTAELQENGETIAGAADDTYDFAERLQVMKQGLEVALKPMANTVFDGLNKFMPTLQKLMEQITPAISKAVEAAAPFVDEFLTGAADALEDVLPLISQLAADLLPVLTQLMSTLLPPLLNLVQTLLPPLMQIVSAILPPIASLLATVLPIITQIVSAVLPVLVSIISSLLPVITPLLEVALQIVNSVIMPLLDPLMQLVQALLPPILSLIGAITPAADSAAVYSGTHRQRARHDRRLGIENCQLRLRRHFQDRRPVRRWGRRQRVRLWLCDRRLHKRPVHRRRGSALPDRGGHQLQPCIPLAKPVLLGRGGPDARGI